MPAKPERGGPVSGKKQLTTRCPECGRPLSVLTTQQRRTPDRPRERVETPIGHPICPVGHLYRVTSGDPYPD
jgi:hypothetical protein